MRWPLASISVTQEFGADPATYAQFGLSGHHGIDLNAGVGTPVYAAESGVVEKSANGVTDKYTGRFAAGETITINGTYETWYMHLNQRLVGAGARVTEGQLIGYSGNTGFSTGPHLHFGTRPLQPNVNNGYRGFINPRNVIGQGGSMSQTDLGIARVLAHGILGRNQSPNNALAGECDADLNRNHVGKETNAKIWEFYNSAEGKAWRDQRYPATLAENATLKANLATVTADRDQLIKKLNDANAAHAAEIKKLNETYQAQIAELGKTIQDQQKTIAEQAARIAELEKQLAETDSKPLESYSISELIGAILRKLIGGK